MPIDKSIQEKVLKIAANKAVNNKTKLYVRKQFYALKQQELEVETQQDDLNTKVSEFDTELNEIMKVLNSIPKLDTVDAPQQRMVQQPVPVQKQPVIEMDEMDSEEEIVMPQQQQKFAGVKVRMQEENTEGEENTDFEVPFEAEEK